MTRRSARLYATLCVGLSVIACSAELIEPREGPGEQLAQRPAAETPGSNAGSGQGDPGGPLEPGAPCVDGSCAGESTPAPEPALPPAAPVDPPSLDPGVTPGADPAPPPPPVPAEGGVTPPVGGSPTAICECAIAKRIFALYNEDRAAHGLAPVGWDEGTARLTTEAARVMAFELEFQHSEDQIKGKCRRVSSNSSYGTFCYVDEERITRYRCRSGTCSPEDVANALYAGVKKYSSRYNAAYTHYSVGVFLHDDTYWLTEWMNEGASLPNGGECARCHCPGREADRVEVPYRPGDTAAFCPHWVDPIWDANTLVYPECKTPHYSVTLAGKSCETSYTP